MFFPVAGIEANPVEPVLFAFFISLLCSTTGISGAFLLLPYQFSILGYTSPGVSATNQIFNILACPAGAWRYAREGRLLFPLALMIIAGTIPGVFIGALVRIYMLPNPDNFRIFAAFILLYLAWRMICARKSKKNSSQPAKDKADPSHMRCMVEHASFSLLRFRFCDRSYKVSGLGLMGLSLAVGMAGGIYGVGGGAIMVPFLTSFFGLPIHAIAGASLFATFITSVSGIIFYSLLAICLHLPQAAPDWGLGLLLGIGGIGGMYLGATLQKFMPARVLNAILAAIILFTALIYLWQSFFQ